MPRSTSIVRPKSFSCPNCEKRFTTKHSKTVHVAAFHQNSSRYRCDYCDKNCRSKHDLESHKRVHTREKPIICKLCKQKFGHRSGLIAHWSTHHPMMVPKCSTYEMDLEKRALKKHLRIHSDDRPFKCNQCSKCFKRRGYLNAHLQRHLSTKRKATGSPSLVQDTGQEELDARLEQPSGHQATSSSGPYRLRARRKIVNYRADQDEESSERETSSEVDSTESEESKSECLLVESSQSKESGPQELPPESSNVTGPKLKLVFDVEYPDVEDRAPD